MDEVYSGLWIGNAQEIRDPHALASLGIATVIDIAANEEPAELPQSFTYIRVPLNDGGGNEDARLFLAIQTVANVLRSGSPAAIACSYGMSRAPTVTAFGLSKFLNEPAKEIIQRIAKQRQLDVNSNLWNHAEAVVAKFAG